jgi:uncharacterized repeat protein (TIGR03943 family)
VNAAGGLITMLVGAVLLRLSASGIYRRYVRVGMGPWLVIAGVVVVVLGLTTLVRSLRPDSVVDAHGHGAAEERVGWLLLVPIAALLLVAPPTLGSYGVNRGSSVDIRAGARQFDPLPLASRPAPMTLLEFGQRAFDHEGASLGGVTVELTGFVAETNASGFRLARYQIACCAADAAPVIVSVVDVESGKPARDQWVTVAGTFHPGGTEIPELTVTSLVTIATPNDPYE